MIADDAGRIGSEEGNQKRGRHRKKQLYNSILQQMEFYFSDSNLTKDRYLSQLLENDPYVDLAVFLKFNKIRRITTNIDDIRKAIAKSELLQLSEDNARICRKTPVKTKPNVDDCTIYVERIKSDVTHDWLSSVFSEFGTVVYVSIPKYKQNRLNKGFAFIEFDSETEAKRALEYFDEIGCKMPSHTTPDELCSIKTYEGGDSETQQEQVVSVNSEENAVDETTSTSRKRKLSETGFDSENEKQKPASSSDNEDKQQVAEETDDKKKKNKKKNKKRNHLKELGLQILSKLEWKKMRNRYLDEQKKKMKLLKQHLHRIKFAQSDYADLNVKSCERIAAVAEVKSSKLEFMPGVIVRIQLDEPCCDQRKLKNEIKSNSPGAVYVDVVPSGGDGDNIYVRFVDENSAKIFSESNYMGKCTYLKGKEEKLYWQKIQNDRDAKLKKMPKKQRGRDKLLKKAEKEFANKHIKFEDNE